MRLELDQYKLENNKGNEKLIICSALEYILNIVCFSGLCINTPNSAPFIEQIHVHSLAAFLLTTLWSYSINNHNNYLVVFT